MNIFIRFYIQLLNTIPDGSIELLISNYNYLKKNNIKKKLIPSYTLVIYETYKLVSSISHKEFRNIEKAIEFKHNAHILIHISFKFFDIFHLPKKKEV